MTAAPIEGRSASGRLAAAASQLLLLLLQVVVAGACGGDTSRTSRASGEAGALTATVVRRGTIAGFAADTLSSAARILALYPGTGADSSTVAFAFADSVRGVSSGLGVLDLGAAASGGGRRPTHLVWPDSVHAVWWSAPHVLSFTTVRGVVGRADVGADTLTATTAGDSTRGATPGASSTPAPRPSDAAAARASAFVDSAHQQPAGRPAPRSALRYVVDSMIAARDGRLVALHVTATDSAGRRMNPAWYALALPSGSVASVDSVVGPVTELPASTGAWGGADGRTFFFARGREVYAATMK